MAEFTAKDVQAPAPGHRRRDDGRQEGARRRTTATSTPPPSGCARRAWPRSAERADRENAEGAVAVGRSRQRRAPSSSSSARPTSWPSPTTSSPLVQELADAVAADGEGAVDAPQGRDRRPQGHAQGEHRARPGRPLRGRPTATCSTPTCTSRTAAASTACSSSSPAATPELAHDIAVHIAFAKPELPHPRRGARRRGRRASARRSRNITRNEGKPEQALRQDRRGHAQRLVQGARCCSSSVRPGREADDHAGCSATPTIVRFAQVVIGG